MSGVASRRRDFKISAWPFIDHVSNENRSETTVLWPFIRHSRQGAKFTFHFRPFLFLLERNRDAGTFKLIFLFFSFYIYFTPEKYKLFFLPLLSLFQQAKSKVTEKIILKRYVVLAGLYLHLFQRPDANTSKEYRHCLPVLYFFYHSIDHYTSRLIRLIAPPILFVQCQVKRVQQHQFKLDYAFQWNIPFYWNIAYQSRTFIFFFPFFAKHMDTNASSGFVEYGFLFPLFRYRKRNNGNFNNEDGWSVHILYPLIKISGKVTKILFRFFPLWHIVFKFDHGKSIRDTYQCFGYILFFYWNINRRTKNYMIGLAPLFHFRSNASLVHKQSKKLSLTILIYGIVNYIRTETSETLVIPLLLIIRHTVISAATLQVEYYFKMFTVFFIETKFATKYYYKIIGVVLYWWIENSEKRIQKIGLFFYNIQFLKQKYSCKIWVFPFVMKQQREHSHSLLIFPLFYHYKEFSSTTKELCKHIFMVLPFFVKYFSVHCKWNCIIPILWFQFLSKEKQIFIYTLFYIRMNKNPSTIQSSSNWKLFLPFYIRNTVTVIHQSQTITTAYHVIPFLLLYIKWMNTSQFDLFFIPWICTWKKYTTRHVLLPWCITYFSFFKNTEEKEKQSNCFTIVSVPLLLIWIKQLRWKCIIWNGIFIYYQSVTRHLWSILFGIIIHNKQFENNSCTKFQIWIAYVICQWNITIYHATLFVLPWFWWTVDKSKLPQNNSQQSTVIQSWMGIPNRQEQFQFVSKQIIVIPLLLTVRYHSWYKQIVFVMGIVYCSWNEWNRISVRFILPLLSIKIHTPMKQLTLYLLGVIGSRRVVNSVEQKWCIPVYFSSIVITNSQESHVKLILLYGKRIFKEYKHHEHWQQQWLFPLFYKFEWYYASSPHNETFDKKYNTVTREWEIDTDTVDKTSPKSTEKDEKALILLLPWIVVYHQQPKQRYRLIIPLIYIRWINYSTNDLDYLFGPLFIFNRIAVLKLSQSTTQSSTNNETIPQQTKESRYDQQMILLFAGLIGIKWKEFWKDVTVWIAIVFILKWKPKYTPTQGYIFGGILPFYIYFRRSTFENINMCFPFFIQIRRQDKITPQQTLFIFPPFIVVQQLSLNHWRCYVFPLWMYFEFNGISKEWIFKWIYLKQTISLFSIQSKIHFTSNSSASRRWSTIGEPWNQYYLKLTTVHIFPLIQFQHKQLCSATVSSQYHSLEEQGQQTNTAPKYEHCYFPYLSVDVLYWSRGYSLLHYHYNSRTKCSALHIVPLVYLQWIHSYLVENPYQLDEDGSIQSLCNARQKSWKCHLFWMFDYQFAILQITSERREFEYHFKAFIVPWIYYSIHYTQSNYKEMHFALYWLISPNISVIHLYSEKRSDASEYEYWYVFPIIWFDRLVTVEAATIRKEKYVAVFWFCLKRLALMGFATHSTHSVENLQQIQCIRWGYLFPLLYYSFHSSLKLIKIGFIPVKNEELELALFTFKQTPVKQIICLAPLVWNEHSLANQSDTCYDKWYGLFLGYKKLALLHYWNTITAQDHQWDCGWYIFILLWKQSRQSVWEEFTCFAMGFVKSPKYALLHHSDKKTFKKAKVQQGEVELQEISSQEEKEEFDQIQTTFVLFWFYIEKTNKPSLKFSICYLLVRQAAWIRYTNSKNEDGLIKLLLFPIFKYERKTGISSRFALIPFVPVKYTFVACAFAYEKVVTKKGQITIVREEETGVVREVEDKKQRQENRFVRFLYKVGRYTKLDNGAVEVIINPWFRLEIDPSDNYKAWDFFGGIFGQQWDPNKKCRLCFCKYI